MAGPISVENVEMARVPAAMAGPIAVEKVERGVDQFWRKA